MFSFTHFFTGLWLALLLGISAVQADELSDLATQAMELSGTRQTLEDMGKGLDLQMKGDPRVKKLPQTQRAELVSLLKDMLDGRRMAAELTAALAATGDASRLRATVAAMHDPVYLKVTRLVVAESAKATDDAIAAYARGLEKRPPDPARIQLVGRLDAATDGSLILADMRYAMAAQMFGGLPMPDREAKLAQLRARIEAAAPEEFAIRTLYAVRKVNARDLEGYVKAHENEAMGWLARQTGYGMQKLILDATGRMMERILEMAAKPR